MLRVCDLRKINPRMEISKCRAGQNYQLLLPMYYYYKRIYINEPLAYYVIRKDSHYHKIRSYKEMIERYELLIEMLRETLESINISASESKRLISISVFNSEKRRLMDNNG